MTTNQPDRLDRIEAIVEQNAIAIRDLQVRQDRTQQQQDRTQQQLDQLGIFVADLFNDVARLAQNLDRAERERVQLTADIRSLVNALQNRFTGNGHSGE